MLIDCNQCLMQHTAACDDCIVTLLLKMDGEHEPLALDSSETEAIGHLAEAGLVPRLRLIPRPPAGDRSVEDDPGRRPASNE